MDGMNGNHFVLLAASWSFVIVVCSLRVYLRERRLGSFRLLAFSMLSISTYYLLGIVSLMGEQHRLQSVTLFLALVFGSMAVGRAVVLERHLWIAVRHHTPWHSLLTLSRLPLRNTTSPTMKRSLAFMYALFFAILSLLFPIVIGYSMPDKILVSTSIAVIYYALFEFPHQRMTAEHAGSQSLAWRIEGQGLTRDSAKKP